MKLNQLRPRAPNIHFGKVAIRRTQMPDSGSRDIPVTATPAPANAPSPAAVPVAVGASVPTGARVPDPAEPPPKDTGAPNRGLMWVAPTVSFAIILRFFAMLGTLLYEEYKPPITIPAAKTPAAARNRQRWTSRQRTRLLG